MGYSLGRYEGKVFVVETTGVSQNTMLQTLTDLVPHSDQLRLTERYSINQSGHLVLAATIEDPWALTKPIEVKKAWESAPETKIYPYDGCEIPEKVFKAKRRK